MLSIRVSCPIKRHLKRNDAFQINRIDPYEPDSGDIEETEQGVSQRNPTNTFNLLHATYIACLTAGYHAKWK